MATGTIGAGGNLATSNDVYLSFTDDTTETQSVALDDTPVDFLTMTSVDWTVEYSLRDAWGDDGYALGIRIVNGATILAAADSGGTFATVASGITTSTDTTAGPTAFAYVDTSASKSVWDGATIELQQTHSQEMGPDSNTIQVDYASFDIEYPANQIEQGVAASTTSTANAGIPVVDVVVEGAQTTVTDTPGDGIHVVDILVQGVASSSTSSSSAGTNNITVVGGTATTTDASSPFQAIDIVQVGNTTTTTEAPNAGNPDKSVIGTSSTTNVTVSAGSIDIVVFGVEATTTDSAQSGGQDIVSVGGSAATTEIVTAGEPLKYIEEGILDEWGHFVKTGIDEWGNKYFTETDSYSLNEWGDWVDVYSELDLSIVFGNQAATTDTAHQGVIDSANSVIGSSVNLTDVANSGFASLNLNVSGASATTTETAHAGTIIESVEVTGSGATTTDIANSGSTFVVVNVIGSAATTAETTSAGTNYTVVPQTAVPTTLETATAGTFELAPGGQVATTSATAFSGVILLPNLIRVQGRKVTVTDTAESGSIGISELLVSGIRRRVFDIPHSGAAVGGASVYRVVLDKRIEDKVFSTV